MLFKSPHSRDGDTAVGRHGWVGPAHTSGVHMQQRLGDEDARAVDLLLDKTATAGQTTMYAVPGNDGFDKRVNSVAGLLRLLDAMPAAEPPPDLMRRTLQRIEQRGWGAAHGPHATPTSPSAPLHPGAHLDPRRPT